jgi:hypothetical protein
MLPLPRRSVPSKANRILGAVKTLAPLTEDPKSLNGPPFYEFLAIKMLNVAHETKNANEILKKLQNFQIIVWQEFWTDSMVRMIASANSPWHSKTELPSGAINKARLMPSAGFAF